MPNSFPCQECKGSGDAWVECRVCTPPDRLSTCNAKECLTDITCPTCKGNKNVMLAVECGACIDFEVGYWLYACEKCDDIWCGDDPLLNEGSQMCGNCDIAIEPGYIEAGSEVDRPCPKCSGTLYRPLTETEVEEFVKQEGCALNFIIKCHITSMQHRGVSDLTFNGQTVRLVPEDTK